MVIKVENILETIFDSYSGFKLVGEGGNGKVYSAINSSKDPVAVKIIETSNLNTNKRKRFKNEVSFCQNSDNKNIIKIIDYGIGTFNEKQVIFYVMPLYDCTLRDKMKAGIAHDDIIKIFVGIANGLKYAHSKGTIHRDIKPENILFSKNSKEPIVADFGIAHFEEEFLITAVKTKASEKLANFQYAAPEQRKRGGKADATTDLYSLALLLNEMFTGEIPQAADYKTIASVNPDYDYLDDLFASLYKQNQKERLQSADEVLKHLEALGHNKNNIEQIKRLSSITNSSDTFQDRITNVEKVEFRNNMLIFTLDKRVDNIWFTYLQRGAYTQSFSLGYDRDRLQSMGLNQIGMPVNEYEDESFIKQLVGNVKAWINGADATYNIDMQKECERKRREEMQQRQHEINRLERENSINEALNSL